MSQGKLPQASEIYAELLKPDKTIRDPVHGDILVNHLETRLMDTRPFQRLHDHHQLGLSYLVYPGATHTRFDHSLGVLYMAQLMVDKIRSNPYPGRKLNDGLEIALIRTCALLHDFVNIPFGHTLEDEGGLIPPDWSDTRRLKRFLGPESEVGGILKEAAGDDFRELVVRTLSAKDDEVDKLPYPFAADIVGNTICADMLDYLARDNYYCGLTEKYDRRFLNYLFITEAAPNHLALRLWSKNRKRKDVLSETIKLLRVRYELAEKVYFHHTKTALSAMLIEAVSDSLGKFMRDDAMFTGGDGSVLDWLEANGSGITQHLVGKIRSRVVYEPTFVVSFAQGQVDEASQKSLKQLKGTYHDPEQRRILARKLENWNLLPPGSVIVYCPDEEMNLKAAAARIEWYQGEIMLLQKVPDSVYANEINGIQEEHLRLWKFAVLIEPKYLEAGTATNINGDCQNVTSFTNDIPGDHFAYVASPSDRRIQLVRKTLREKNQVDLTGDEIDAIVASSSRRPSSGDAQLPPGFLPPLDWYLNELESLRSKK